MMKGVLMLVSAISTNHYSKVWDYNIKENNDSDTAGDTTFNSLTPYSRKTNTEKGKKQVFDSINEWKNFCHSQILKGKLDVIA